jgi:hypothetical protein
MRRKRQDQQAKHSQIVMFCLMILALALGAAEASLVKNFMQSNNLQSPYSKKEGEHKYEFGYQVEDDATDTSYGHVESRDGEKVVSKRACSQGIEVYQITNLKIILNQIKSNHIGRAIVETLLGF